MAALRDPLAVGGDRRPYAVHDRRREVAKTLTGCEVPEPEPPTLVVGDEPAGIVGKARVVNSSRRADSLLGDEMARAGLVAPDTSQTLGHDEARAVAGEGDGWG